MQDLLTTVLLHSDHWHILLCNTVLCEPSINMELCILLTDISCYKVTDDDPHSGVPSLALDSDWTVLCTLQKTQITSLFLTGDCSGHLDFCTGCSVLLSVNGYKKALYFQNRPTVYADTQWRHKCILDWHTFTLCWQVCSGFVYSQHP